MTDSLGHVLISSMKDEGPYVLEFVAHHRVLGFDRIFIASNDCRDGTDLVLDALAAAGAIGHTRNVLAPGDIPQHKGYALMRAEHGLDRADWLMVLDADEFLQVTTGAGRVQDLTAAAPDGTDIIALNPMTFGTSDDEDWRPGRVTQQFVRRVPPRHRANRPIKTLTRGLRRFRTIHNHCVNGYRGKVPLQVMRGDGALSAIAPGTPLWQVLRNVPPEQIAHGLAHYNHYAVKSLSSFCLRHDRGRGAVAVGEGNTRHTEEYFARIAGARIEDRSIERRYGPAVAAELARLMAIPAVAAAQAEAERRYAGLLATL
ncbi:glycosyltransferase family 2 protein [Paracoccus endophyticus]|uniref:glycosyltransferase family 2 protein n=1 Tax=Paracoccus endophyticus TaxID=2233774 RepID=UPI000DD618B3|nr:glycosyltransferase family 2 protein [Paracoccus endophyticus]